MTKTLKIICLTCLGLGLVSCGQGTNSLQIALPDQQARDDTVLIRISVVKPGDNATCQDLLDMGSRPGDPEYQVEQELVFDYPLDGNPDRLKKVGPGTRLFYAEAENSTGQIILNGCTSIKAGADGPGTVAITLDWLGCEQTNGGVEICDGLDNDCLNGIDDGDALDLCPVLENAIAVLCTRGSCTYDCQPGWFDADQNMDTGCECRPTRDGDEWCDGVDNDCDGVTDGPGCTECSSDADCSAPADCMGGTCADGSCQVTHFPDDTTCNDGDGCTENETCQGGFCLGQAKDCDDSLDCTDDSCDSVSGTCSNTLQANTCLIDGNTCVPNGQTQEGNSCLYCDSALANDQWQMFPDGSSCDDGLWCTGMDTCDASGQCQHTALPCTNTCQSACDEDGQTCEFDDNTTACDDGYSCTENETCDGQGNCVGIPEPGYCGTGQECLPDCATDALGCVDRPNYINMTCPTEAGSDESAVCTVELVNGQGLEGCLQCQVELLPSIISDTAFYNYSTSCDLGNWEQVTDAACQTNNSGYCPYTMGDNPSNCCDSYNCNTNDRTIEFRYADCATGGWRLHQTFDFSSYESVRACYGVLQGPDPGGGSLEILTDPGDQLEGNVVSCDGPGSWADSYPSHPCIELPGSVTDMDQTRLSFWAQINDDFATGSLIGLDGIKITAYPPECDSEVAVVETDFSACGHDVSAHDGWTFSTPANCAEQQDKCGRSGGLLLGSVDGLTSTQIQAQYEMDLTGYTYPGKICWNMYTSMGFGADFRMDMHSIGGGGAWYVPIFDLQYQQWVPADDCREICIDLDSQMGQNSWGIGISATITSGYMLMSDFKVYASQACDATGVLSVSEVQPDGQGGHQVLVDSTQGLPRRARVNCTWGNEGMTRSAELEFRP